MKKIFIFVYSTLLVAILYLTNTYAVSVLDTDEMNDILKLIDTEIQKIDNIDKDIQQTKELDNAVSLLHKYKITIFDSVDTFMADKNIRRDEAAKMYAYFMENVMGKDSENMDSDCNFNDLGLAHSDLPGIIKKACSYKLFKGYKGNFMPRAPITNAQAVVVLIRMIDGYKSEVNVKHYAQNYMERAEELGLLKGLGISDKTERDKPATRGTIAKLLYRAKSI